MTNTTDDTYKTMHGSNINYMQAVTTACKAFILNCLQNTPCTALSSAQHRVTHVRCAAASKSQWCQWTTTAMLPTPTANMSHSLELPAAAAAAGVISWG